MADIHQVLLRMVATEKAENLKTQGQYMFYVVPAASKGDIKAAVEAVFKVKVTGVRVQNYRGKNKRMVRFFGRRPARKRAIVCLAAGHSISVGGEAAPAASAAS